MGDSPYLARSAFAGNERLISLDVLHEWGWLSAEELCEYKEAVGKTKSWDEAWKVKKDALWRMSHKKDLNVPWSPYADFCKENAYWLDDYALFRSVSDFFGGKVWTEWPDNIRCHAADGVAIIKKNCPALYPIINSCSIFSAASGSPCGNMPMTTACRSSATCPCLSLTTAPTAGLIRSCSSWTKPEILRPSPACRLIISASTVSCGAIRCTTTRPWLRRLSLVIERFRAIYQFVDEVRIDHFRGLESYWAVPAEAKTAREGAWVKGPGLDLFRAVYKELGFLPMVAEDLGIITDDVCA